MRRTTEAERRRLVAECRVSGKSKRAWCRDNGIPYSTFGNWTKKMPKAFLPNTLQPAQWAEITPPPETPVMVTPDTPSVMPLPPSLLPMTTLPPAKIVLKNGGFEVTVEAGFEMALLTNVLQAVKLVCC